MSTLLLVHAHPDDETISTGGIMLRAHRAGHRVVLVTCTRGEQGQIHNMDPEEVRPRLGEVRTEELRCACAVLGVDRQEFLGYRDSGMANRPSNDDPDSFHQVPLPDAAERLAPILREERPDVVVTYTPDGTYGHPDHIKAHQTTVAALDLLAGEGWQPGRFYHHAVPRSVIEEMQRRMADLARDSAAQQMVRIGGIPDEQITTVVDVRDLVGEKRKALECHVSQLDPRGPWASVQSQLMEAALGWERFVLVRGGDGPEGTVSGVV